MQEQSGTDFKLALIWVKENSMPLGTQKASLLAAAGADTATNYFGDESDGAVTTSGDVTYTVLNKVGSYDGDMVVKQFSALTISTGDTITVDQQNRGMFIYVTGDCTINGTLSMTRKGGHCDPTASGGSDSNTVGASGLQLGLRTASGSETFTNDGTGFDGSGTAVRTAIANEADLAGDGTIYSMVRTGSGGGAAGATGAAAIGTGGGGGPAGGGGGCFSGGAGAGGVYNAPARPGAAYGGAGGDGYGGSDLNGGSGNPGGTGYGGGEPGQVGVGGIIWLVVKGNITVGASGKIECIGGYAGHDQAAGTGGNGGGGSGGGAIQILHGGTYTNNGTVTAAGGIGPASFGGGTAGAGGINSAQVAAA